ncbi:MAG: 2-iminoacetate synthase ThiH [Phycisphaerales bacterium]|nr:MAG: 2-iminoacetate synthase ThiH [Phycisphaerales bacterium]
MLGAARHTDADIRTILAGKGLDGDTALWQERLRAVTDGDVERALAEPAGSYSFQKLVALVSPAAENYLEQMARLAHELTVQRFGRTIRLYAPLYLSNYCTNPCRYCGFNRENKFKRTRLTIDQALAEARIVASEGFRELLLVSSEDREFISVDYLAGLARRLRDKFSSISIEIYQMSRDEYGRLFEAGIEGVTLYQETYDRQAYGYYHPSGPKSDYDRRLSAADSIAAAGMREVGLGALLGLTDWRVETLALAEHAHHIIKRYWQSHVSFSFPRLRPAYQVEDSHFNAFSDRNLVQMITALRLCFADVGLVLSTRERARLRDNLLALGVTRLSAGSRTSPGGYVGLTETTGQFEIDDKRTPAQVAAMMKKRGFEPVWKDWDRAFLGNPND